MCELAMALGKTLGEIRSRVTQEELGVWVAYVEENGPLNTSLRVEAAVARAVAPFLRNAKPRDLMPWPRQEKKGPTLQEMAARLKVAASHNKRRKQ